MGNAITRMFVAFSLLVAMVGGCQPEQHHTADEYILHSSAFEMYSPTVEQKRELHDYRAKSVSPNPQRICAENGSCYGDISKFTHRPKRIRVKGYYRKNGTYVRGHYRSSPR